MKTVLIAEDDRVLARLLCVRLQQGGFATLTARDVPEAINVITRQRVDAVVLDINMPGGSGTDVIQRMKTFNRTGPIPILVVSGTLDDSARHAVMTMGAELCLPKPPDMEGLVACIRQLTHRTSEPGITSESAPRTGALARASRPLEKVVRG